MSPPAAAAAAAAPALHPRPGAGSRGPAPAATPPARGLRTTPRRPPRRVSGQAQRAPVLRKRAVSRRTGGFVLGLLAALETLSQHRLLDRLIRSQIWIGLVAFALIGIVTLQLGLLKLNATIGRALEREALLQRQNAALQIENSELAADREVVSRAERLGMVSVPLQALRFVSADTRRDPSRAADALRSAAPSVSAESATPSASAPATAESETTAQTSSAAAAQAPTYSGSAGAGTSQPSAPGVEAAASSGEASSSASAGAVPSSASAEPAAGVTTSGGSAAGSPGG